MKPTLLFATLSMVLGSPATYAKSELEILRSRCAEQERQIQQLENENARLRSGGNESRTSTSKSEVAAAKPSVAATKTTSSAPSSSSYTVIAGDSMEKIARKVGANPDKLAKANGLNVNSIIHPGQKLKVPGMTAPASPMVSVAPASTSKSSDKTHKVQQGETFSSISKKHGISAESLAAANPKVKPTALRPGQIVNLSSTGGSTTMISTSTARPKTSTAEPKAPEARHDEPATKPAPAPSLASENKPTSETTKQAVVENAAPSPTPEKKIRPITIDGEMTYGEFAAKHGTDAERLNALNGLDLTTATVLAKGSELYVPAQP